MFHTQAASYMSSSLLISGRRFRSILPKSAVLNCLFESDATHGIDLLCCEASAELNSIKHFSCPSVFHGYFNEGVDMQHDSSRID
jgi:hypothetical protein